VEEGERYNLSKVTLAPNPATDANRDNLLKAAKFKLDAPADFLEIGAATKRMTKMMQRDGFMRADASVERLINDKLKTVDLTITIHEGPQFTFGKLAIEGSISARRPSKIVGDERGKPFDADYPDYFVAHPEDSLFDNLRKTKSVAHGEAKDHARGGCYAQLLVSQNLPQHTQHYSGIAGSIQRRTRRSVLSSLATW
jgi:hypothetical protein